ncbi:hypothetical protein MTR67_039602 [Solanum verrucosum]|uniref:Tf2-1-like SH3-like domain-containing protein n=1 Tax=Solanum verrucosum TaxID=315347 RepID=A0AAF0ZNQ9_SOLVR|nr:hypothetical protein MTR67_039602 [Solanum verrucosum]
MNPPDFIDLSDTEDPENFVEELEKTSGQEDRTIQILENMLRACVFDFKGLDLVHQAMEKVKNIQERLKTTQSRQKSYTDVRRRDWEFEVDDYVYLKVSPMNGFIRFGKKWKLSPRYIGPYRISKRIDNVAYELELLPELATFNSVFHISMLKNYMGDPSLIIPTKNISIKDNLSYEDIPIEMFDCEVRRLRTKEVASVKVFGRNQLVEEDTWEVDEDMKKRYPHLFTSREIPDQGNDLVTHSSIDMLCRVKLHVGCLNWMLDVATISSN